MQKGQLRGWTRPRLSYRLPEGEKDDEFDGDELQQGRVLDQIAADLAVELDDRVEGDGDADALDAQDLLCGQSSSSLPRPPPTQM